MQRGVKDLLACKWAAAGLSGAAGLLGGGGIGFHAGYDALVRRLQLSIATLLRSIAGAANGAALAIDATGSMHVLAGGESLDNSDRECYKLVTLAVANLAGHHPEVFIWL